MNSALITINSFPITSSKITIAAGATVNVALICTFGVSAWSFLCTSNGDPTNRDLINASIVYDGYTCTFTVPSDISNETFQFTSATVSLTGGNSFIFDAFVPSLTSPINPNPPSPDCPTVCCPNPDQSTQLGGDLAGFLPNPTVVGLQGNPIEAGSLGITQDGYVLTWSGSHWQAAPATASSIPASAIFRPGGVAGGNVYTTDTAIAQVLVTTGGNCIVFIDQSLAPANISSGVTWNFHGLGTLTGGGETFASLTIQDGGQILNPPIEISNINVVSSSRSIPSFDYTNWSLGPSIIFNYSELALDVGSTQSAFVVPANCFLGIVGYTETFFSNDSAPTVPVFKLETGSPGGILFPILLQASSIGVSCVSGDSTTAIQYTGDASAFPVPAFTGFTGTVSTTMLDSANGVAYSDTVSPVLGATNVQAALDAIKARLGSSVTWANDLAGSTDSSQTVVSLTGGTLNGGSNSTFIPDSTSIPTRNVAGGTLIYNAPLNEVDGIIYGGFSILDGYGDTLQLNGNNILFTRDGDGGHIRFPDTDQIGSSLGLAGQNSTASNGGSVIISAGLGSNGASNAGSVQVGTGVNNIFLTTGGCQVSGKNNVNLNTQTDNPGHVGQINFSLYDGNSMNPHLVYGEFTNGGDSQLYIAQAVTNPTGPVNILPGGTLYVDSVTADLYFLDINGVANQLTPASSFTAGGDLSGTSTSQQVTGILNQTLPSLPVSDGYLNYTGSAWQFSSITIPSTLPPSGSASGDLSGSYPNPTVSGLEGHALPGVSTGYLNWNGSAFAYTALPTSLPPSGAAGGALSGTYPNPTITSLPVADLAAGTAGQILLNSSTPTPTWTTVSGDSTVSATGVMVNVGIQTNPVSSRQPASNQALEFDGTNWIPFTSLNNLHQLALLKWSANKTLPALATANSPLGVCTYLSPNTSTGTVGLMGAMVAESNNLSYIVNNTITNVQSSFATVGCISDGTDLWFILGTTANNVVKLNPTTGQVIGIYSVPNTPQCVTYFGGFVWIGTNSATNNLNKITTSSGSVATFTAGATVINCIYTDTNGFVWCGTSGTSNNLIKVTASTGATANTYTIGAASLTTVVSDGTFIYVTSGPTLSKFSISGGTVSNTYLLPSQAAEASLYDGTSVWFSTNSTSASFMQFNISTAIISAYSGVGITSSIYDDGTYIWSGNASTSNNLNRLTLGGTSTLTFGLADITSSVTCSCYDAVNTLLWFGTNGTTNNLIKCNGTTGAFIASFTVGTTAIEAIATGSDGFIWCGMNATSSNLAKITASTGATAATFTVGALACTGLYDDGTNVWFTNGGTTNNLNQFVIGSGTSTAHTAGSTAITCVHGTSSSLVFVGNSATTNNLVKWTGSAASFTVGTTGIKSIYDDGTNVWCGMNATTNNLNKVTASSGATAATYTVASGTIPSSVYSDATNVWIGSNQILTQFNIGSATTSNTITLPLNSTSFVCRSATTGSLAVGLAISAEANTCLWTPANTYTSTTFTVGNTAIEGLTAIGGNLYAAANSATNGAFEITPATGATANNYNLFYSSNYICFDGANFWSTSSSNNEVIKSSIGSSYTISSFNQFTVGNNPQGICFDGYLVWTTNFNDNTITSLTNAGVTAGPYSVGTNPQGICFDGYYIWTANHGSSNVTKLLNGTTVGTFAVGTNPHDLCFDGYHIWVTNTGSNTVSVLRPDGTVKGTFATGTSPQGICFDGDSIWIANNGSGTVTQLNVINGNLINTFTVGTNPTAICFDGVYVYVTNTGSNTVTKL